MTIFGTYSPGFKADFARNFKKQILGLGASLLFFFVVFYFLEHCLLQPAFFIKYYILNIKLNDISNN